MTAWLASVVEPWKRSAVAYLVGLSRYQKRTILAVSDFVVLSFVLWLEMSLRLGELFWAPTWPLFILLGVAPVVAVAACFQLQLYRHVTRHFSQRGALLLLVAVGFSALFLAVAGFLTGIYGIPRSVVMTYPLVGAAALWGMRRAVAAMLLESVGVEPWRRPRDKKAVLIYGAGSTGVRLLEALRNSGTYQPAGFIDTSPNLWRQYVGGLKIFPPSRLPLLVETYDVKEVLLALPKASRAERQAALQQLEPLMVRVRTLPAMEDLATGRVTISDLRHVDADDLLGRDPIPPNPALMAHNVGEKSVLVTGAGGSIGSELVRQILRQKPRRLVLFDRSEEHLYEIGLKVGELSEGRPQGVAGQPEIVSVLGSVQDSALVRRTMEANAIDTVYHAAAFKHVPLLEHNAIVGLRNNTFGTAVLADTAATWGVERFVLISTDKAVRPTSIMGASKRLAEMILQARSADAKGTVFTMVRFGNVLDSSGSVVRRFRRQIEAGGPVTVTHPDIIRYFMSIPEAAALVIQAGAMATGGDVFVLDMGEPVKIDDLARRMIRLMGFEVRDKQHPEGDIAITYTGLRDGEKLHEELLIGENTGPTQHPRILKSREPFLPSEDLAAVLDALRDAMAAEDMRAIREILTRAVEGFGPEPRSLPPTASRTVGTPLSGVPLAN